MHPHNSVQCNTGRQVALRAVATSTHSNINRKRKKSPALSKEARERVDLQFLQVAVRNVMGAPVRHGIELNAVRELHPGGFLRISVTLSLFRTIRPASKSLSPKPESGGARAPRALVRGCCLLPVSFPVCSRTKSR